MGAIFQSLNNASKWGVENGNRFEQALTCPHFEGMKDDTNRP
jgi:hypothetical protein